MVWKFLLLEIAVLGLCPTWAAIDLSKATGVVRGGVLPPAEQTAAEVLIGEVAKRTGIRFQIASTTPASGSVIAIRGSGGPVSRPDGYGLSVKAAAQPVVSIEGSDARGALYGVGNFCGASSGVRV